MNDIFHVSFFFLVFTFCCAVGLFVRYAWPVLFDSLNKKVQDVEKQIKHAVQKFLEGKKHYAALEESEAALTEEVKAILSQGHKHISNIQEKATTDLERRLTAIELKAQHRRHTLEKNAHQHLYLEVIDMVFADVKKNLKNVPTQGHTYLIDQTLEKIKMMCQHPKDLYPFSKKLETSKNPF